MRTVKNGWVSSPKIEAVCGECYCRTEFMLGTIGAGTAYQLEEYCLNNNGWQYDERVLCPDCKS